MGRKLSAQEAVSAGLVSTLIAVDSREAFLRQVYYSYLYDMYVFACVFFLFVSRVFSSRVRSVLQRRPRPRVGERRWVMGSPVCFIVPLPLSDPRGSDRNKWLVTLPAYGYEWDHDVPPPVLPYGFFHSSSDSDFRSSESVTHVTVIFLSSLVLPFQVPRELAVSMEKAYVTGGVTSSTGEGKLCE